MKRIAIQVSEPSKNQISPDIKSIAILNRSLNNNFAEMPADAPEDLDITLKKNRFYDSSAADSALISAAKAIYNSQRFDVVVPSERYIWRDDKAGMLLPLDSSFINGICKDFEVDAVLVLEDFSQNAFGSFRIDWMRVLGTVSLTSNLNWRFYQPGKDPLNIPTQEELYWYGGMDDSRREHARQLPPLKDMLTTAAIVTGELIANQIGPKWQNEKRHYYRTGRKQIDKTIDLIKSDKWEEAKSIWANYSNASRSPLKYKIEYNLALASEMTGDMDKAVEWSNKSYQTKPLKKTENYSKYLINRKTNLEKIYFPK